MQNLYIVNLLLAISTTVGMSLIPILTVKFMGLPVLAFAVIEATGELVSGVLRLLSGFLFDKVRNKKILFMSAGVLSFLSKFILLCPTSLTLVVSKLLERLSNGVFAAPRDAFAGVGGEVKSSALSKLSVCKGVGCTIGSIITAIYLSNNVSVDSMLILVSFAAILCFISVFLSNRISLKTDINFAEKYNDVRYKIELNDVLAIVKNCFPILLINILFFLGRFNDGMITLFLESKGFSGDFYFLTIGIFNGVMIIVSPFFGKMLNSDNKILALKLTIVSLITFNMIAVSIHQSLFWSVLMLFFWGVQRAGSQITFMSLVFDRIPSLHYGLAAGIYSFLSALSTFICSCACGYLQKFGFVYVFKFSCFFAVLALIATLKLIKEKK